MSVKIKAGTNFVLPVEIEDSNFNSISAIEFLFKQTMTGEALKTAYWSANGQSRDASQKPGERTILVSFSREDSYKFAQNKVFFMDTRIHYEGSVENPFTKVISLNMSETLFAEGEEVEA